MACHGIKLDTLDETCIDTQDPAPMTLEACKAWMAERGYQWTCYSPAPFNSCRTGVDVPNADAFCNGTKQDDHLQAPLDRRGIPCCSGTLCSGFIRAMWDCQSGSRTANANNCWAMPLQCRTNGGELSTGARLTGNSVTEGETSYGPGGTYYKWGMTAACGEKKICDDQLFRRVFDLDNPTNYSCLTVARFPDQNCQFTFPDDPAASEVYGCSDQCDYGSCCAHANINQDAENLDWPCNPGPAGANNVRCVPWNIDQCADMGGRTGDVPTPETCRSEQLGGAEDNCIESYPYRAVTCPTELGFGDWLCTFHYVVPADYPREPTREDWLSTITDWRCRIIERTDWHPEGCIANTCGDRIVPGDGTQCCACGERVFSTDINDCAAQGGVIAGDNENCENVESNLEVPCRAVPVGFADRNADLGETDDFWGLLPPDAGKYQPATVSRINLVRIVDYAPGETSCRIYFGSIREEYRRPGRYAAVFCEVRDRDLPYVGRSFRYAAAQINSSGKGEFVLQYRQRCGND